MIKLAVIGIYSLFIMCSYTPEPMQTEKLGCLTDFNVRTHHDIELIIDKKTKISPRHIVIGGLTTGRVVYIVTKDYGSIMMGDFINAQTILISSERCDCE